MSRPEPVEGSYCSRCTFVTSHFYGNSIEDASSHLNDMKHFILFILIVVTPFAWSQKGFKVIRKAEQKMEQGNYQKALRLLDKADGMNYGFCGNAWIEAQELIVINRATVYAKLDQPLRAADTLNALTSLYITAPIDSLKTVYYVEEFGKERVKREIDSCIALITSESLKSLMYYGRTNLYLDVRFSAEPFSLSYYPTLESIVFRLRRDAQAIPIESVLQRFKLILLEQPFYQVLL